MDSTTRDALLASDTTQRLKILKGVDFSVELLTFNDNRLPESFVPNPEQTTHWEYEPDKLLGGVKLRIPALMRAALNFNPQQVTASERQFLAEIDLRMLRTNILTGTFTSGPYGRYNVEVQADVVVRDRASRAVLNQPFRVVLQKNRPAYRGGQTPAKVDEARMMKLADSAIQTLATDIAWALKDRSRVREYPIQQ